MQYYGELTIFLMLYTTFPRLTYFLNEKFVCFNPISYFTTPLETMYLFCVSMSMFVLFACLLYFLYSIHNWDYMVFIFLFIISLRIISCRSIHVEVNGRFHTSLWLSNIPLLSICACSVTQSFLTLCDPMDCSPPGSSVYVIFQARNTGMSFHVLLQEIFPIQGSNSHLFHLLHWQVDFYHWATWEAIYICLLYSSIDGHLDWFHILAINATMNFGVPILFQISGFVFFW